LAAFDFVPIKLAELPLDTHLKCEVFSKNGGDNDNEYSMLCEDKTLTQEFVARLKRTIFPSAEVYIDRPCVVSLLFDKGHSVGFSPDEIEAIRKNENPWEKKKPWPPITDLSGAAPAVKSKSATPAEPPAIESNASFHKKKFDVSKFVATIEKYNHTKEVTRDMIEAVAKTNKVDVEQSMVIATDIQTQLDTTDAALIIQAINQIRGEDEYLHSHSLNVAYLNGLVGRWLGYDPVSLSELVEVGLLHDIGKLAIDPEILHKPSKLTDIEFHEIKKHPILSMEMMMKSGVRKKSVLDGVFQHHEKVNGQGYPNGIDSKKICEYARVTSISDVYDAMVTKRVYKDAHSPFTILNEFAKEGYSALDVKYVNIFIGCMIEELRGKEVIMNDGSEATVLLINPRKLLYPIVEINGEVVTTSDDVYCVRMKDVLS
jgi:HD-GYP domain-containing protein (c-di-GMP phosphodiesterase class II)